MKKQTEVTKASQQYAAAYAVHYKIKDLNEALDLYEGVMAAYPDTSEAGYSRTQIQNIAKSLVPKEELLAAEMVMARSHLNK